MKIPETPPLFADLMREMTPQRFAELATLARSVPHRSDYLHWDRLRRLVPPDGLTHREWWLTIKVARHHGQRQIALADATGQPFRFSVPEVVLESLHKIDFGAGGKFGVPAQVVNPENRHLFLAASLIEEAITSSQLEGAATTRKVAAEMIRTGRKPRDLHERMILNNYRTMQRIRELKDSSLTPELVFDVHRMVTDGTLDDPTAAGRFRRPDERVVVGGASGEVVHTPPPAAELPERMAQMCDFANGVTPDATIPSSMEMGEPRGPFSIGPCCAKAMGHSSSYRSRAYSGRRRSSMSDHSSTPRPTTTILRTSSSPRPT